MTKTRKLPLTPFLSDKKLSLIAGHNNHPPLISGKRPKRSKFTFIHRSQGNAWIRSYHAYNETAARIMARIMNLPEHTNLELELFDSTKNTGNDVLN